MISAAVSAVMFLMATARRNDQSKRPNDTFPFLLRDQRLKYATQMMCPIGRHRNRRCISEIRQHWKIKPHQDDSIRIHDIKSGAIAWHARRLPCVTGGSTPG